MSVKDLFDIDWDLYNRRREAQVRDHIRRENLKKAGIDPDAKKNSSHRRVKKMGIKNTDTTMGMKTVTRGMKTATTIATSCYSTSAGLERG